MATAVTGLQKILQDNFAAGSFQSVARHLIPDTGIYEALNSLFDEDGAIYKRGGSTFLTPPALGSSLRWQWDGVLAPGARTMVANPSDFGVVNAAGTAFVNLGGAGLSAPVRATVFDGMLFLDDGTIYGGSRLTADYSTGTVSVTVGSAVVTGSGTTWTSNVDAGMLLRVAGAGRYYTVKSVDSNTQITLNQPYQGSTASGQAYALTLLGTTSVSPYVTGTGYASIFNRLLVMSGTDLKFSGGRQANGDILHTFGSDDDHPFSGTLLGVAPIRDLVFVFTTDGMFVVTGMDFDLLDPDGVNFQQSVELANSDLILWGKEGIATYQNQLLIPGVDGLWTLGPAASPELLTRSIQTRWRAAVHAGYRPGVATVFRNHYFMPVLSPANDVVDCMVVRLDRRVNTDIGPVYPWSFWNGQGGNVPAFATRISGSSARQPVLLGADPASGRLMDLTGAFEPDAANKDDADGTTAEWMVEGRDVATGPGNRNHVRRLKIWYTLTDAADDDPTIIGYYSVGSELPGTPHWDEVNWGEFNWTGDDTEFTPLAGQAPEDTGRNPYTWYLMPPVKTRFVRWRLRCTAPVAGLTLRSAEWSVRPSGRQE